MTNLRGACAVARPVVARVVRCVGKRASIRLRAGQDVVAGRQRVTDAVDEFALFGDCEFFVRLLPRPRFVQRVAMYFGLDDRPLEPAAQIVRDPFLRVVPGTLADPVSRINSRLTWPACVLRYARQVLSP